MNDPGFGTRAVIAYPRGRTQVRERLDYHKRKQSEVTDMEKELDERISRQMEEEEELRRKKKERKKEKEAPVEEIDPEIAAMMGFGGFGSSKKK